MTIDNMVIINKLFWSVNLRTKANEIAPLMIPPNEMKNISFNNNLFLLPLKIASIKKTDKNFPKMVIIAKKAINLRGKVQ